jgi:hypothetical protein
MSEYSQRARSSMSAKATRLARGDPHAKVDASSWVEGAAMNNGSQTGERPISPRAFASGGVVGADAYLNRDVKKANEERPGIKHIGGFCDGGRARAQKFMGGPMGDMRRPMPGLQPRMMRADGGGVHRDLEGRRTKLTKSIPHFMHGNGCKCGKCSGGRAGKAFGGAAAAADAGLGLGRGSQPSLKAQKMAGSAMKMTSKQGTDPYNSEPDQAKNYRRLWTLNQGRPERKSGGWIAGAIKHPGALHKELNVPLDKKIPEKKLQRAANSSNPKLAKRANLAETLKKMPHKAAGGGVLQAGARPQGGRIARASGGKAKKGMNVNIIITQQPGGMARGAPPVPPRPMMPPPGPGPVGLHQAAPPPPAAMGPPAAAGAGAPPPMGPPPMMPRKSGGRAYPIKDGAGGGKGRLQKIRAYG